jgi:hypothetical protein
VQVGLRDLDVVAEHPVEPDLERRDAGAGPFGDFHLGDHLPPRLADGPQLVDLGVEPVAREAAVAGQGRRLVDDRARDHLPQIREVVELGPQADQERRRGLSQRLGDVGNDGKRSAERGQVTWTGCAQHHAAQKPLDVVQGRQPFAHAGAFRRP